MICTYSIEELRRAISKKAPQYLYYMDKFLYNLSFSLIFVPVPLESYYEEQLIRDEKDRPLLRAAIRFGAEYFLTGDKDFLESQVKHPKIINVSDFLEL